MDLGVRLYQRRLSSKSKVSGLFAYDEAVGACILLNANHPWERRVQSAAHELGHFVGTRQSPEVLEVDEKFLSREERYANAFGRAFLTPRKSFSESFRHLTEGASRLTRRHVVLLAHQFNVSREACVRRLEELDLVRKGTWEWFVANGGISSDVVKSVLGEMAERDDPAKEDANRPVSQRLALRAYEAWSRDLMSEGQLAELLKVPRVALRKLLDQIEMEESETDDFLKLSR
ncbi:ImmA/IrrE family metallo-endopeptidase [Thalassospira sp.]|uniref:ImmA/IrrE family metallo-endopeptidase n=1 Tax=Thalassospira sp. TaxID=1912094 RepID=UPI0026104B5D|nr:ImmA/IrrE family metallo-endopeptidase [Thalassospira sp.]